MRWAAAVVAVLVTVGVAGCSGTGPVPTPAPSPASASSSASTAVKLTGDAAFEAPIVCRAVHDYDTVQTAIGVRDLHALHRAAAAAAVDDAAGFAEERARTWIADLRPFQTAYFAKGAEQVQWFREIAKAKTIDDAINVQFPDGTTVTTPVFAAIHLPDDSACPA